MTELDTAAERERVTRLWNERNTYVLTHHAQLYLDAYDRLRAENQRLRLEALTAESQAMEIEQQLRAENRQLAAQHEAMADALVTDFTKRNYLRDEVTSVLELMDGLAEQWGDEGVFRRCRDRLRSAVESTGGGDE